MTLADLLSLGCYLSAGYVDYFDGKHHRVAEFSASAGLTFFGGYEEMMAEKLAEKAPPAVEPKPEPKPEPKAKKAK